jgi:hypothetical protein
MTEKLRESAVIAAKLLTVSSLAWPGLIEEGLKAQ